MLKRVVIENYRSCVRTSIELHPNVSVFIGPNSSGKTNILQAIMLLKKLVAEETPFLHAGRTTPSVSSRIKATFQQRRSTVQLDALIGVHTDQSNNDVVRASRQKWQLREKNGQRTAFELPLALVSRAASHQISPEYLFHYQECFWKRGRTGRSRVPSPAWAWEALRQVAEYCRGMTYYSASQFTNPGACPASFEIEQEGTHRTLSQIRGHAKILYKMYSARKSSKERYTQFMEIVGPKGLKLIDELNFRQVETSATDYSVRVGGKVEVRRRNKLLVIPQFRIGKQKLSPNQLSEGTFKTLALLFHVINDDSTVLLIEEPEVCVHHGLLSSILELVKSASHNKQMILSTHSDYVLDHVEPENVFRVSLDKRSGTVAHQIQSTMNAKEYAALREYLNTEGNLGDYWREGGLGDRQ